MLFIQVLKSLEKIVLY